ncbi:amino acid ABC transporter ATP-binding protein, partial [Pseudomonas stutzeri]|nr:amino acid ABC transporter ATP-binding protein [Stutzerimonas stutzeri]
MIQFEGVNKWYKRYHALNNICGEVRAGEVLVVCGPSGSGKSTMIRTINRLEAIQRGTILVDGVDVYRCGSLDGMRSHIGFVFQQFNLFPHMNVQENLMMAPVLLKRMSKAQAREHAQALLERVGLGHKATAYPGELSGGQQQRVAIARALAMKPRIM